MSLTNFESSTESYSELQEFRMNEKRREFPECEPDKESNGMAVFMDTKVLCADIFGNKEVYKYYFPMLRDSLSGWPGQEKSRSLLICMKYITGFRKRLIISGSRKHHDESCTGAGSF
jgi:hypothetical protein